MEHIQHAYHTGIVLLSILVSILGSNTALGLSAHIADHQGKRIYWLFGSAIVMGMSGWAMNFTGLLALRLPHYYSIRLIFLSLLVFILFSAVAQFLFYGGNPSVWKKAASGAAFGMGFLFMFYTGLLSISNETLSMDPIKMTGIIAFLLVLSVFLALFQPFFLGKREQSFMNKGLISSGQGLMIAGFHYLLMQGVNLSHGPLLDGSLRSNQHILSLFVAVVALFVFTVASIVSYYERSQMVLKANRKEVKYRSLFENNQDGIIGFDAEGNIQDANDAVEQILGYPIIGKTIDSILHPEDADLFKKNFTVSPNGAPAEFHVRMLRHNLEAADVRVKNVPLLIEGRSEGTFSIIKDISQQRKLEKALKEQEDLYRLIAEHSSDLISIIDPGGRLVFLSLSHEHILGYKPEELAGNSYDLIAHRDDKSILSQAFCDLLNANEKGRVEFRFQHKNGEWIWFEAQGSVIVDGSGQATSILVVSRDIGERKIFEQQLKEMAFYDELTGVPNRRLFDDRLKQAIQQAKRKQTVFALCFMDLDRFKWVNDTHGHETGDELLKGFVDRARGQIREADTLARLGGDEFVLLLNDLENREEAESVAKRILEAIDVPWEIGGKTFIMTSSIGIAFYPDHTEEPERLLQYADQALYKAKERGRNGYFVYTKEED